MSYPSTGPTAQPPYGQPVVAPAGPPPYAQQEDTFIAPGWEYASYGQRVAASLLDTVFALVCVVPGYLAMALVMGVGVGLLHASDSVVGVAAVVVGAVGVLGGTFLYLRSLVFHQGTRGQSWGKQIAKIQVVQAHTMTPIGVGFMLARLILVNLLNPFTLGLAGGLDLLWPLWDKHHQALHDKVAASVVVRRPA